MTASGDEARPGDKELEQSTLNNGSLSDGPAEGVLAAPNDEKAVTDVSADPAVTGAADVTTAAPAGEPLYEDGRSKLQTVLIMVSLCSALFLGALDVTVVTVAIPTIVSDFKSTVGYTWIGSAYLLSNAATAPSWGKISDIWGRKPVILGAVAIFWVGSLLCAVSRNMTMLIVARAIQGIGSGGIIILVNVCISDLFSMRKRGQYYGFTGLVWAVAGGIGPVVGGALTEHASWRWCFYINLPISGAGFILLVFVLKLHNPKTPMRAGLAAVDWLGSFAVSAGTLLVLLGLTFGDVMYPWKSAAVISMIVIGTLILGAFAFIEARIARYPIIPMRLFSSRVAVASFVCCFFHGIVFVSGSYYLPLYFQAVLGATPLLSGVYVLPYSIGLSITSAAVGIAIKKTGKYLPFIIAGFVLLTAGFGLFTNLGDHANWAKIILYQIVASLGVGPNFQATLLSLHTTVDRRDVTSATATFGFIRQMSTTISVVIGGVVFQNQMQQQHGKLVASLGAEAANLLSGSNAASSVDVVSTLLSGPELQIARSAYWVAIRTMFIMYAALAGAGLVASLFIKQSTLSTEHVDHKTGLDGLRGREDDEKAAKKAKQTNGDGEAGVKVEA